jgi:hypothetical protein
MFLNVSALQRPVQFLEVSTLQMPELHLDVSALQRPVQFLEVSTLQGPELHLDVSHYRGVYCSWWCLPQGLSCIWTCLHYRGMCCFWRCLQYRDQYILTVESVRFASKIISLLSNVIASLQKLFSYYRTCSLCSENNFLSS